MKASLNSLHHQGNDWLRELEFYRDELRILRTRLEEVASKNTDGDVLAMVEHFENRFVMLREQADILKHDVNRRNEEINELSKKAPEHIDEKFIPASTALLNRVGDFTESFAHTRFEFNDFLSKNM